MNLLYKTSFEIEPSIQDNDTWHGLVRIVREWIRSKLNLTTLAGDWFFNGGTFSYLPNTVTAKRFYEQSTGQNFWALRFEETGNGEHNMYKFITDIGIEEIISNQRFRFSIRIRYAVQAGYVGYEPKIQISCPKLVKNIISRTDYAIYSGHLRLNDHDFDSYENSFACVLKPGEGHKFLDLLQKERYCPVILVSRTSENHLQLDARKLSRLLAGSAMVFVESSDSFGDVNRELIGMKPLFEEYRCQNGMVRVYKPELDFTNLVDYRRHRFFSGRSIDEKGSDTIIEYIFRAVLNRSFQYESEYIFSIGDVERRESRSKIEKLKRDGGNAHELNQLYEEELAKLNKDNAEKLEKLQQEKDWWEQTALQVESEGSK